LTSSAGRWSATHPRAAILAWLVGVAGLLLAGHAIGTAQLSDADMSVGQAGGAEQAISRNFDRHATEYVLFTSARRTIRDASYRKTVADVVAAVESTGAVRLVQSPLDPRFAHQVSADGRAALLQFQVRGPTADARHRVVPVLDAVRHVASTAGDVRVAETGDASIAKSIDDTVVADLHRAEWLSFPMTLVVLLVAFGTVVAALVPLGLAVLAILAANGLVAFSSHLSGVSVQASSVMLLIGLAVGVDYSMFYVKRQREERARGCPVAAAIEAAAATSGRSVLVSGVTVLAAMAGMFLMGSKIFVGMGQATMIVVAVAVVGSLTLLPALLAVLGDRLDRGRLRIGRRRRRRAAQNRMWAAVLDRALGRPWLTATLAAGVLVVLALPALRLHTAMPSATDLPHDVAALRTYDRVQHVFPGGGAPAIVVVEATDVTSTRVQAGIVRLERAALASGQMNQPISVLVSANRAAAIVRLPLAGNGENAVSVKALQTLRREVLPATLGGVPGVRFGVTGLTAGSEDFNALMRERAPWVFAFVLLLAFVTLLVSFRSLVIAMTAVALTLLSVAASYGVLVALFQWGWGESLLGFTSVHAVTSWLPLFLFVVLFGLSMDYHVFVLSRVREAYDRGMATEDAVAHGIRSTAGVITSAALVMVGVFALFGTLDNVALRQMGVGLAIAVALDATVIRGILLPASMKMLGDWNWWLPRRLGWLPRVALEGAEL
jgi:uncharacterized membrane protein YdfJ with MMPL/SSD domain